MRTARNQEGRVGNLPGPWVEARGFEPLTPAMRTQCSPAELRPHVRFPRRTGRASEGSRAENYTARGWMGQGWWTGHPITR